MVEAKTRKRHHTAKSWASMPEKIRLAPQSQIGFRCSEELANMLVDMSRPYGGIRQLIVHWMQELGHEVPKSDAERPDLRRRTSRKAA